MRVYRKITLLGWQWYLSDGLFEKPISKKEAEELIFDAKVKKLIKENNNGK